MKTTRNAIAVGLLTTTLAIGLYGALKFVSESAESTGQYRVWAVFPDATGLVEKSQIRIAGIPVGYIETISLYAYNEMKPGADAGPGAAKSAVGARVDFVIDGDVVLYRNGQALRSASGLLGNQFVVLLPGDATADKLRDGDRIVQTGDAGLFGQMEDITTDIRQVTNNLKTVFGSDEGAAQMGEVLANLKDISQSINELVKQNAENVNRTMENIDGIAAETRPEIRTILEDMKIITQEIRVFVEKSGDKAENAVSEADDTIKDIRQAVSKLDRTLENLAEVSDDLNNGEGTVGRLLKDDKLIDDVEEVVEEAGGFIKGITQLKTIVGLQTEFNILDKSLKTALQLRLQPREDKYYLIEAVYDPRGNTTRTERVVETTNPNDPPQYREVEYKTRDSLLFSFMFARRLRFVTFRFGIKESSGGAGVDFHLLRDRIEFQSDLYRFGDDIYPHLRGLVAINFLKHFYFISGITDALNPSRDYFVGLMLRFNDEDLKTILPFAPAPG